MAATLRVPFARVEPWPDGLNALRSQGFAIVAFTPDPAARPSASSRAGAGRPARLALRQRRDGTDERRTGSCGRAGAHSDPAGCGLSQPGGGVGYRPLMVDGRRPSRVNKQRADSSDRVRVAAQGAFAQQASLPLEPLAALDIRLLHRAGAADVRPVRPRDGLANDRLAGARDDRHRDRRAPRLAARHGGEARDHLLHGGSSESILPARLLHRGVERDRCICRAQRRGTRARGGHRQVAAERLVSRRLLPDCPGRRRAG